MKGGAPALAVGVAETLPAVSSRLVITGRQGPSDCGPVRVKRGDRVHAGQVLFGPEPGDETAGSVPVHSPVSGKVVDVQPALGPDGEMAPAVTVEADDLGERVEPLARPWEPSQPGQWPVEELRRFLRMAGVDGAPCPVQGSLYERLERGLGGGTLVVNAVGCEPGLPSDMLEAATYPTATLLGAAALGRAAGAGRVLLAVHRGDPADEALTGALAEQPQLGTGPVPVEIVRLADVDWFWVPVLLAREALAVAGLRRRGSRSGEARPMMVESAATAVAAGEALVEGWPVTERLVTISARGRLRAVRVPIGTPVASLLQGHDDGQTGATPVLVLVGGPLQGAALPDLQLPVTKSVSAITAMPPAMHFRPEAACVRCGRCVEACPAGLLPLYIARAAAAGQMAEARALGARDCLECGACTVLCPSYRPLLQWIRLAKYGRARRPGQGGGL